MASLPLSSTISFHAQFSSLSTKPTHFSTRNHQFKVRCSSDTKSDETENSQGKLDRRNLLLGMGGVYGATNLVPPAFATPISAPDLAKCSPGDHQPPDVENCCPPLPVSGFRNYKLPPVTKIRCRPPAHLASKDEEYVAKYKKAVEIMKALPADDPRNFMQQANVHCAYCECNYEQTGYPDLKLDIHGCWLFFPWHRWYLYFYERILGKLINDPTFSLPFWNWDNPPGMVMPDMYLKKDSPLFDPLRNPFHRPPSITDLKYSRIHHTMDPSKIIPKNLTEMYKEMVTTLSASSPKDFYGHKYVVGTHPEPGGGAVELGSHNAIHLWTGQETGPREDMGVFATAARDSIFFSHHANIDRLWSIWQGLRRSNKKPAVFSDPDWLDANFLFYDENAQLVRVSVKDALHNEKMGYTYQEVDIPWLRNRPKARVKKSKVAMTTTTPNATETANFPVKLDKVVKVVVDRPKKSRSKEDKEREEELLVIEGIEVDTAKLVRFEVYVNDEDDEPGDIDKAEYAGCYSRVPHKNSTKVKTMIRLGLTELLEDLDVEDDDKILVSLVPNAGGEDITIDGIKIIYD